MQSKEQAIKMLTDELNYCYCDTCKFSDYDTYKDKYCEGCYRKYSNWALSPATAEEIVDKLSQLGEIYPASKEELREAINNAE